MSDDYLYSPGETALVNTKYHSHTVYISGRSGSLDVTPSKFNNSFERQYDDELIEKILFELDFYYKLLSDSSYFDDVMDLYGEVLGCWCLPNTCHGESIVDFLTYGFEKSSNKNISEVSNTDDWVLEYIQRQLTSYDSTIFPPRGVAYRARLEERIACINDGQSGCQFSSHIEEYSASEGINIKSSYGGN